MGDDQQPNVVATEKVTPLDQQPEPIREKPWYAKLGRRLIALVFVLATFFLFGGIYQLGLLRQTPEQTPAGTYTQLVEQPNRSIPTTVFVLKESKDDAGTNIDTLVEKTNAILKQAAVGLSIEQTETITVADLPESDKQISGSADQLRQQLPELNPNHLHIAVTPGLTGINGVAFVGRDVIAVAEYNSTFDFRVLAHEVGHILTLRHTQNRSNLMRSGGSGTTLSVSQAQQAYEAAGRFTSES